MAKATGMSREDAAPGQQAADPVDLEAEALLLRRLAGMLEFVAAAMAVAAGDRTAPAWALLDAARGQLADLVRLADAVEVCQGGPALRERDRAVRDLVLGMGFAPPEQMPAVPRVGMRGRPADPEQGRLLAVIEHAARLAPLAEGALARWDGMQVALLQRAALSLVQTTLEALWPCLAAGQDAELVELCADHTLWHRAMLRGLPGDPPTDIWRLLAETDVPLDPTG